MKVPSGCKTSNRESPIQRRMHHKQSAYYEKRREQDKALIADETRRLENIHPKRLPFPARKRTRKDGNACYVKKSAHKEEVAFNQ